MVKKRQLIRLFKRLAQDSDTEWEFIDDSYGLPIEFIIIGGDVHDSKAANELIELLPQGDFVIADKGYDSEYIRNKVRERNSSPVIPIRLGTVHNFYFLNYEILIFTSFVLICLFSGGI